MKYLPQIYSTIPINIAGRMLDVRLRRNPEFRPLGRIAPVAVDSGLRPETHLDEHSEDSAAIHSDCCASSELSGVGAFTRLCCLLVALAAVSESFAFLLTVLGK